MRKRTGVAARAVAFGLAMLTASSAMGTNAKVFPAPGGRWAGRVPLPHCPTTCFRSHGTYLEPGSGFDELRRFAAENSPDQPGPNYSPGIVPVPLDASELDTDGDGVRDRYRYAHPFEGDFPARRHCSAYLNEGIERGWDANGGASTVLLFERDPADRLDALGSAAFLAGASRCAAHPPGESVSRGVLPVFRLDRERGPACPDGYVQTEFGGSGVGCAHEGGAIAERNLGARCPALMNGSNPVNAVTGNKYQRETDYPGTVRGDLGFDRHYNSQSKRASAFGAGWTHGYDRRLVVACIGSGASAACSARAYRADGRVVTFTGSAGRWEADPIIVEALAEPEPGVFVLTDPAGRRESYAQAVSIGDGTLEYRVSRLTQPSGREHVLEYDGAVRLARVIGPSGRELRFEYDAQGRLRALRVPGGRRYDYAYDVAHRLVAVTYPDEDDLPGDPADRTNNPVRTYLYEDARHPAALTGIIDENGDRFARWQYDAAGRAILSEHAGGASRVAFDYQPGYTAVTDARGQTRGFSLRVESGVGLIAAITGASCNFCGSGRRASVSHDANGFEDLVTDYEGNVTDLDFNPAGLLVRRTEALGTAAERTTVIEWDTALRAPLEKTVSSASGAGLSRTTYRYASGRLRERVEEDLTVHAEPARVTRFRYFGDDPGDPGALTGLLKQVDGPREDVSDHTDYAWDAATGNLATITNALGHVTRYAGHDADGRPLLVEDANGVGTALRYDPRGRLVSRAVDGATSTFEYDAAGQMLRATFPDGTYLDYAYDAAHRLEQVTDALGNHIVYGLDALGNRVTESTFDSMGTLRRTVQRTYDVLNRLERIVSGEGQVTTYAYNANGDLVQITDPRGPGPGVPAIVTTLGRDALNRIAVRRNPLGDTERLTHDALDRLARFTAANGAVTAYSHNGFGEVREEDSPDAGTTIHAYDAAGNRIRRTDARGVTVSFAYDALNRLTLVDYPAGTDVVLTYDEPGSDRNGIGRLTTVSDESGSLHYWYDRRGNVIGKGTRPGTRAHQTHYRYNSADRLTDIRYPHAWRVHYDYDAAGRPVGVSLRQPNGTPVTLVEKVGYAPFGPAESWVHGNGVAMSRPHDRDYRISELGYAGVLRRSYRYDARGNVETITDAGDGARTERYEYDAVSRLTRGQGPWGDWNYTYDANGNRLSFASPGRAELYRYVGDSNRPYGVIGLSFFDDYATDAAGNVVSGSGEFRYVYGEDGRLASIAPGAGRSSFALEHNGLGLPAAVIDTIARDPRPVTRKREFAYDEAGRLLESIVYEDGSRSPGGYGIAYLGDTPIARWDGGRLLHLHTDHLGTPVAATDGTGTVVARTTVPPFGGSPEQYGSWDQPHGEAYPGQIYIDGTSHVFLNGHREYDARAGRYLQSDPIGLAGGTNTFAYAENNPVRFIDPSGLDIRFCFYPQLPTHIGFQDPESGQPYGFRPTRENQPFDYGEVSPDPAEGATCKTVETDPETDACMASCRARRQLDPGFYNAAVRQCTEFVRSCAMECGLANDETTRSPLPRALYLDLPGRPDETRGSLINAPTRF